MEVLASALQVWSTALGGLALLLILARLCRLRQLPPPPLPLPTLAVLVWALLCSVPLDGLPSGLRLWLSLSDDLLLAFAALRLLLWLALELPAGLRWWRPPPQLLLQLLMMGAGALVTVVVLRRSASFDLVGLVTTSAVLTAVVGLAAQESLKDLFAGLELQLGDDFKVGDWLDLGNGVQGVVETITWRDTMLRNLDGYRLIIPNSRITEEVLTNWSVSGVASNRFTVGLDYSFAPAQARALLEEVARQHPRVLADPAPKVRLLEFGESAISYELHVWQQEIMTVRDLRSELLEQIWYALQRAGQSIPFPVRELQPRRRGIESAGKGGNSVLAGGHLFAVLTAEQRRELAAAGQPQRFGPGEAIVREGDSGDCLFQVLQGQLEVAKASEDGRQLSVGRLGPGEVFGEMTLLLDAPRSATVRALEECELLRIHRPAFRRLLDASPALLEKFARLVEERQAELEQISIGQTQERTQSLLERMRRLFLGGPCE